MQPPSGLIAAGRTSLVFAFEGKPLGWDALDSGSGRIASGEYPDYITLSKMKDQKYKERYNRHSKGHELDEPVNAVHIHDIMRGFLPIRVTTEGDWWMQWGRCNPLI